jgi:hypothetical protein
MLRWNQAGGAVIVGLSQQRSKVASQAELEHFDWAFAAALLWTAAMVALLIYVVAFASYPS